MALSRTTCRDGGGGGIIIVCNPYIILIKQAGIGKISEYVYFLIAKLFCYDFSCRLFKYFSYCMLSFSGF